MLPGLLPGKKLGLANIVVMYALFFMGPKQALVLDLLKALFVFLVSGWTAGFLSLCGGLLSLLVMWLGERRDAKDKANEAAASTDLAELP